MAERRVAASRPARGRAHAAASHRRVGALAAVALISLALFSGCRKQDPSRTAAGDEGTPGAREEVLAAFADCTLAEVQDFRERAALLVEATRSLEAEPNADTASGAQIAWESAIDRWQELELFQFGPAAMSGAPGGQDIRSEIYVWPQFNRCLIEQLMVNRSYRETDFGTQFANARGLGALEYLLFYEADDNLCPASNPINSGGTWAALVAEGLRVAKAEYALAAAEDVQRNAETLAAAWEPDQGGFRDELAHAGRGSTVFATTQAGLNVVGDALFYLDTEVKDRKLAAPLGLVDCTTTLCPELVESPFAGRSKLHVRNNLVGFRKLFAGCSDGEGLGFDDLLADIGQDALAGEMTQAIDAAIAAVDAIEEPSLELALTADVESVRHLHVEVKAITDLLKTEFVTVLHLELPAAAAGDND